MKSSLFLVATSALLASANPLQKRVVKTEWVYDIVTVTVTDGQQPPSLPTAVFVENEAAATPEYTAPPEYTTPPASNPPPASNTPTEEPSFAPPTVNPNNYKQTMLDQHNVHRANHSAPALTWSNDLAQYAANTANKCVFEHDMTQGGGGYGQNLASWGGSGDIDNAMVNTAARAVTEQWYNGEFNSFQYYGDANPTSNFGAWGHFTQVVWASTTEVGCATVKCPAGTVLSLESWYTVCNYNPPGNFGGRYAENVLKPIGNPTVTV